MTPAIIRLSLRAIGDQETTISGGGNRINSVERLVSYFRPASSVLSATDNPHFGPIKSYRVTSVRQDGESGDPPIDLCNCRRRAALVAKDAAAVGDEER